MNVVDDYDEGFKEQPMFDQLARVMDSVDAGEVYNPIGRVKNYFRHFNPVDTVTTDDGWMYEVTPQEADEIRKLVLSIDSRKRGDVFKQMQNSKGFEFLLRFAQKKIAYEELNNAQEGTRL
jgi:hypothetical protein